MPTQEEVLLGLRKLIGPVRTGKASLEGKINRNALNRALSGVQTRKARRASRKTRRASRRSRRH
jgi:hypothetical protein